MSRSVEYSEMLQRRVRRGDTRAQTASTWATVLDALERHDAEDAAALTAYAVDEATIHCDVMAQWRADLRALLTDKGRSAAAIAQSDAQLLALLPLPDGRPFDLPRLWHDFLDLTLQLQGAAYRTQWDQAAATVAQAREVWRQISDRDVDWCCGLMNELVVRCGEEVVPEMWECILWPLFTWRYDKFDVAKADWTTESLPTLLYVALEAMRAYLSTPGRDGAPLELEEHADRYVLRFDPCGSGGRAMRGDDVEGTPSRLEPPYNVQVIEGAYDWTDGKPGVCVYCNHCQVVLEHWPMDKFGYPLRVIEPPTYPASDRKTGRRQKCQWTMYKDPTAVPEAIYERAGRTKPTDFGSHAQAHQRGTEAPRKQANFIGGG